MVGPYLRGHKELKCDKSLVSFHSSRRAKEAEDEGKTVVEDAPLPYTAWMAPNGGGTIPSTRGNSLVYRRVQEIELAALEFYNTSKFGTGPN